MLQIGIVGAGASGLLLALLLQRQGHAVQLFERAPELRSEGCGILLVRAGVETIAASGVPGLLEELLAAGLPVQRFVVRNLRGDTINTSPAERAPGELPSLLVPRQAILNALWHQLDPACFRGGSELESWEELADGVVEARFADGHRWHGDLLVGADGLFSQVARGVAPQRQLRYLGDRVWRGVVDDDSICRDGSFFVYARGRGIYANCFDLGPGPDGRPRTHWGFFQEEPLPASRAEQRRLLAEPVPAAALAKLPADVAALIAATPAHEVVANWSFDIDPLPALVKGPAALIGDAAHAMSSSQARGMTAGLEDALALARQLAGTSNGAEASAALQAWQAERLPVVHAYQERSRSVSRRTGRLRPPSTGQA
jgi:2-polyprenyl-6-methoxyphenol hydroxylase-like FAD-dependent oxidoreductase